MQLSDTDVRTALRKYDAKQNRKKASRTIYVRAGNSARSRICFSVLKVIEGMDPKEVVEGTEKHHPRDMKNPRPVSATTIRNWRLDPKKGGTLFPQTRTMERVLLAQGYKLVIGRIDGPDITA